jgi:hypothetical protein
MALLLLFRFVVPHVDYRAAGDSSGKQNQGPMGIDGQSFGEFLEVPTLSVLSA